MTLPGGEFFDCLENTQVRRRYNAAEEFGEDRLIEVLSAHRDASAQHLQAQILASAGEFCANRWHDDATLLILAAS